jgi:transcriptional regulator with XRE-family HTH domain
MAKTPNLVDGYAGSRVRMRRLMLEMSQTVLADGLGLTFQQVQKYEKGTNRISASRLQQIANILQVPVAFFFEGSPVQPGMQPSVMPETPTPSLLKSRDGIALRLARAGAHLSPRRANRQREQHHRHQVCAELVALGERRAGIHAPNRGFEPGLDQATGRP